MATKNRNSGYSRPCPKCAGVGSVPVSGNMGKTLVAVGDGATLAEVQGKLKVNVNTVTARLARLLTQGLVDRELSGDGRTYLYKVKEMKA